MCSSLFCELVFLPVMCQLLVLKEKQIPLKYWQALTVCRELGAGRLCSGLEPAHGGEAELTPSAACAWGRFCRYLQDCSVLICAMSTGAGLGVVVRGDPLGCAAFLEKMVL